MLPLLGMSLTLLALLTLDPATVTPSSPREPAASVSQSMPAPRAPRELHLLRASLEMATVVGAGVGWYEWQIELNKQDFDFARTRSDQWRRLVDGKGYRFDDNERYLNVGHAFMGALYYDVARVNGANAWQSALFAFATSTFWETTVEHREVVSINDEIITGVAGVPIGESLFQVGEVFARSKPTWRNRLLMGLFSPTHLAAWAAGDLTPSTGVSDRHGLDATTFHRFDFSLGAATAVPTGDATAADRTWTAAARVELEVIALPSFCAAECTEGHTVASVSGGDESDLVLAYVGSNHDMRAFDWFSRATMGGTYHQNVQDTPRGLRGEGTLLGVASAFELAYDHAAGIEDFLTLAHLLGPTAERFWFRGNWRLRMGANAYGDFAFAQPQAVRPDEQASAFVGAKSTLQRFDYYYGWGVTGALALELTHGLFRTGAQAEWNHVGSIQGLDRHQEAYTSPTGMSHAAVSNDDPLSDERGKVRAFAEVPLPLVPDVKAGAQLEVVHRAGTFEALARSTNAARVGITLTYAL